MAITPQNVVRHELIGLNVKVYDSKDPTQRGLSGKVVDESFNTLTIESGGIDRVVVKSNCTFIFTLPDRKKVKVEGTVIVGRPEDRIKKNQLKW
jgi:ribonuclease P protein subunit POP4